MTEYSRSRSYHGSHYDKYMDNSDGNTLTRVQQQYWATKQAVFRKLGKKEDECIVASDAELDAKLELFRAIEESCTHLMRVLEAYQDKLCAMSHEENALGRFLKENGKQDKTRAGKMMIATGKTLSYTAQQRLALRVPLVRLYQEVETFQYRAITDTCITVDKMEKSRTAYRGALMWMKDVSQQLDPDMYKQMEKFKKVQGHVRKTKTKFEKLKVDTLQKVDLLSASRCNMFSHALAVYQNTLLQFWEKTAHTMNAVSESFRGYQHYEFSMLKELTEPSKKLAEETASQKADGTEDDEGIDGEDVDKDKLIFFEAEYHDDEEIGKNDKTCEKSASLQNLLNSPARSACSPASKKAAFGDKASQKKPKPVEDSPLLNLGDEEKKANELNTEGNIKNVELSKQTNGKCLAVTDLLTESAEVDDTEKDDMTLLSEILSVPLGDIPLIPATNAEGSFSQQWQAAFGNQPVSPEKMTSPGFHSTSGEGALGSNDAETNCSRPKFLPSQLLEATSSMANMRLNSQSIEQKSAEDAPDSNIASHKKVMATSSSKKSKQQELSDWFNLFADLDPLANPDSLGKKAATGDNHNC